MRRNIALALLLYIWPAAGAFNDCPTTAISPGLTYIVGPSDDSLLFCPDTDATTWAFASCKTPGSGSCTTGNFSFSGQFSSNSSSCFDSGQACVRTEDGVSTLFVCVSGLTSDSGRLEFVYTPDGAGSPILFIVDYAPIGISLLMDDDMMINTVPVVNTVVGSQEIFGWLVRRFASTMDTYKLFHITPNTKELLFGTGVTGASNLTGVTMVDPRTECIASGENRLPMDYALEFASVNIEHAGVYSLEVAVFDKLGQERSFTSNVTLIVQPSSTMPTSTSAPTESAGTTSTASPSATGETMEGPAGFSLLIVIVILAVVVVIIIAATLMIIPGTWFWKKKQTTDLAESGRGNMPNGSPNQKYKRTSVASDHHPLVASSSTPSPGTTPTTKTPDDFVGLLYEEEYANSYTILKGKYPDLVRELQDVESVIVSLSNQQCIEIIVIVNIRTSPVFKELNSRAIPMDGREKVKFVLFGKDSTPGKNVEAQGYQVVILDGDPQEEDTFSELLTKLEQPVYRQTIPSPAHLHVHGRMNSDPIPLPPLVERPQQGRSETDHPAPPNDRMSTSVPVTLPAEVTTLFKKQLELQEANLEESKKRNALLEDINKNTSSINQNTAGMQEVLETAVVDEGAPSSTLP